MVDERHRGPAARTPEQEQFGQNLRALRQARGWSQERFAQEVDLHRTYVGGCERGEYSVSFKNVIRFARALEVPPAQLFNGIE